MFLTLIVSSKSLLPCEVSYSRVLRMGCGHCGGITVILSIMGGSTLSHTSLNQFVKQHNKAKSSCLCLERCIFSLEFSICASVFHSTSSLIAVFVADGDRIRVHLTLQLFSWASITRPELRLQESWCGEQKADPRSELCIAFQDWSLSFLFVRWGGERVRSTPPSPPSGFTFPESDAGYFYFVLPPTSPLSCLLLWKHVLRVLPRSFYSHLSFFNSFLNSPPAIGFNIVLWIHSLHFWSQNHPWDLDVHSFQVLGSFETWSLYNCNTPGLALSVWLIKLWPRQHRPVSNFYKMPGSSNAI